MADDAERRSGRFSLEAEVAVDGALAFGDALSIVDQDAR